MHQTLDGGCTDFSRVLKPKIENRDPMGTQKLKKGSHGDPGPQMGTHVGAVNRTYCEVALCAFAILQIFANVCNF